LQSTMSYQVVLTILALCLQTARSACAAGAKPFPSSKSGKGKNNYADLFSIDYKENYKVIEYSPTLSSYNSGWHPVESMKGKPIPPLVLYQCGTPKPTGFSSEHRFFEIPVQKAALGWGGALPFFELLSVTEHISLIDLSYISSPCTQLLEHCTPGIHMGNGNAGWAGNVSQTSDVVFTDSFGTGWAGPEKDIPFQISLDPGSLQRAEWVRFVAAFFNEDDKADEIFTAIQTDYNALKGMSLKLSTDSNTEWKGRKPKVAWITKSWDGKMKINNAHYKIDFVEDAGGVMVPMPALEPKNCTFGQNTDGAKTLTCPGDDAAALASFKKFLAEADVIIDESYVANYDVTAFDFATTYMVTAQELPALARNPPNIFRLDGTISDNVGADGKIGSHWFEGMPSQPQQLLAGMMEALWSDHFQSSCGFKYLRRVLQGQAQVSLGHHDCPYHSADGNHDCAGIHNHMHEVPKCSEGANYEKLPTTTTTTTAAPTTQPAPAPEPEPAPAPAPTDDSADSASSVDDTTASSAVGVRLAAIVVSLLGLVALA